MNGCVAMIVGLTILLAIGGGIGTGINKIITSTRENNEKIALEKQHKSITEEFTKNKEKIIADIKKEISVKNYDSAITKSEKYSSIGNEEITKLKHEAGRKRAIEKVLIKINELKSKRYSSTEVSKYILHFEKDLGNEFRRTPYYEYSLENEYFTKRMLLYDKLLELDPTTTSIHSKELKIYNNYKSLFNLSGNSSSLVDNYLHKYFDNPFYHPHEDHVGTYAIFDGEFLHIAGIYTYNYMGYLVVVKVDLNNNSIVDSYVRSSSTTRRYP
jgi:hypothetical protein